MMYAASALIVVGLIALAILGGAHAGLWAAAAAVEGSTGNTVAGIVVAVLVAAFFFVAKFTTKHLD